VVRKLLSIEGGGGKVIVAYSLCPTPWARTPCLSFPSAAQAGCSDPVQGPPWPTGTARAPNVHTPSSPGCRTRVDRLPTSPAALSPRHPALTVPAAAPHQQCHRRRLSWPSLAPVGTLPLRDSVLTVPSTRGGLSTRPGIRSLMYGSCQVQPTAQVQGDDQVPSFQQKCANLQESV